ncbi:CASP-like protein 1D1 [Argentina anserina]|uniref:CASP-like protein 1D1 n=1 Tax=Argentina anserina TaxID=57926 RepID=UPI0021766C99|nr:CASP-like protein 1D1 [Potentilla anserina]
MASTDNPADPETGKEVPPPKASCEDTLPPPPKAVNLFAVDVALRFLVFAASLTSVLVIITSKQTVYQGPVPFEAKFDHSPAFIYFIVALSIAGLYSILTTLASLSVMWKPIFSTKFLLHFAFLDVLILGLVASATGTAGGVAYIGYKGNDHVQWRKVCSIFDKYCKHIAGSLASSLFASILLVLLVWLSTFSLHKKLSR